MMDRRRLLALIGLGSLAAASSGAAAAPKKRAPKYYMTARRNLRDPSAPIEVTIREGSELIYRADGPWGAGMGRPLTAEEVDENFWEIDQRLRKLEDR